jgi:hypothetical protein
MSTSPRTRRSKAKLAAAALTIAGALATTMATASTAHADPITTICGNKASMPYGWTLQACIIRTDTTVQGLVLATAPSTSTDVRLYVDLWRNCGGSISWVDSGTNRVYPPSGSAATGSWNTGGCTWQAVARMSESGHYYAGPRSPWVS